MVVRSDPASGTVTLRLSTGALAVRVVVGLVVGVGAPALAEALAPGLVVPALLLTAAGAALVVEGIGRTVVLDDHGITLGTSRRRARRVPWSAVGGVSVDGGRLLVTTTDGRRLRGPRVTVDVLATAQEDAALLGIVPR